MNYPLTYHECKNRGLFSPGSRGCLRDCSDRAGSETDFEISLPAPWTVALARCAAVDDPKVCVIDVCFWITWLGTVKQIEEIHSKFCGDALAEEELLCKAAVQVVGRRGAKSTEISRRVPWKEAGIGECRRVEYGEPLVVVVVIYAESLPGNKIGTIEAVAERIVVVGKDGKRRPA